MNATAQTAQKSVPSDWRTHAPEFIVALADLTSNTLQNIAGLHADSADLVSYEVIRSFCDSFGGSPLYVPKIDRLELCEKYRSIWLAFTGQNHAELARKYRISLTHVYRIIKMMRENKETGRAASGVLVAPATGPA